MKKKRNFLTKISSILGVFTLTSLFCCSIFFRSDKKSQGVKAIDTVFYRGNGYKNLSGVMNKISGTGGVASLEFGFDVSFELMYYQQFVDGVSNYSLSFTYTLELLEVSDTVNNIDSTFYPSGSNIISAISNDVVPASSQHVFDVRFGYILLVYQPSSLGNSAYYIVGLSYGIFIDNQLVLSVDGQRDTIRGVFTPNLLSNNLVLNYRYVYNNSIWTDTYVPSNAQQQYDLGYQDGYQVGYDLGVNTGYQQGNSTGYTNGYNQGYDEGVASQQQLIQDSYAQGKSDGLAEGESQDSVVTSIFSGILQVALVPINFFLAIFNFEILGINLSAFIRAIFTVVLTIIVIKTVMGKGGGGSDN